VAVVDAGDAGQEAGCTSNAQCPPTGTGDDVACDISTGQCLTLTSAECPSVIGDINNTVAPPIFLGSFVVFPTNSPLTHPSYLNYGMALSEFATNGPGIPAGPRGGKRTP